jgi:hypothetical protein
LSPRRIPSLRGAERRGNLVVEPQLTNQIATLRPQHALRKLIIPHSSLIIFFHTQAERSAYLARDGWAANTMFMGSPGEVEFALSRSYIDDFELIAMSYIWLAPDSIEHIRHWPASAEITPREYDLLMGEGVPADFALESWMELGRMAR